MMILEEWSMTIMLSVTATLVLLVMMSQVSLFRMRRRLRAQQVLVDNVANDIRALFSGAVGEGNRIHKLEARTRRIVERQEQMENSKNSERPYEQAIRMVQKGSSVEDLISVCNLSKGEADLIMMVHGRKDENDTASHIH